MYQKKMDLEALLCCPARMFSTFQLKEYYLFVKLAEYARSQGTESDEGGELFALNNKGRDLGLRLEEIRGDQASLFQEYQNLAAIAEGLQSLVPWDNVILLKLLEEKPNRWQLGSSGTQVCESIFLYNDIFCSLCATLIIVINTYYSSMPDVVKGQGVVSEEAVTQQQSALLAGLDLAPIVAKVFTKYEAVDKDFQTKLSKFAQKGAFDMLFSLLKLVSVELVLILHVVGRQSAAQALVTEANFLNFAALYRERLSELKDKVTATTINAVSQPILANVRACLPRFDALLGLLYYYSAKAARDRGDMPLALKLCREASSSLASFDSSAQTGDAESLINVFKGLNDAVQELLSQCSSTENKDASVSLPSPGLFSLTDIVESFRASVDAMDGKHATSYKLLLYWDEAGNRLVFTPPANAANASLDALDGLDLCMGSFSDGNSGKDVTAPPLVSAPGEADAKPSIPKSVAVPAPSAQSDTDAGEAPKQRETESLIPAAALTVPYQRESEPEPIPTAQEYSKVKADAHVDHSPAVALPEPSSAKGSRLPTPSFSNSLVDRAATGEYCIERTHDTKVPSILDLPAPRPVAVLPAAENAPSYVHNRAGLSEIEQCSHSEAMLTFTPHESIHISAQCDQQSAEPHFASNDADLDANISHSEIKPKTEPPEQLQELQELTTLRHALPDIESPTPSPINAATQQGAKEESAEDPAQEILLKAHEKKPVKPVEVASDLEKMTERDLICNAGDAEVGPRDTLDQYGDQEPSIEPDSIPDIVRGVEDAEETEEERRQMSALNDIAVHMQQTTWTDMAMTDTLRGDEAMGSIQQAVNDIINDMDIVQSDNSLKLTVVSSARVSGSGEETLRGSKEANASVALSAPSKDEEKEEGNVADNTAAPALTATMRSSISDIGGPAQQHGALSCCDDVSMQQSVGMSKVNDMVLSLGTTTHLSVSAESVKKFLSDSRTSLGMSQSTSLSHSYIRQTRLRKKATIFYSRFERLVLLVLLLSLTIGVICTM